MTIKALQQRDSSAALGLAQAFVPVMLVAIATAWTQLGDPFVRHDDFPALLGDEEEFLSKTLSEGRWLNYFWIARPFLWSSQANYLIYLIGWALLSSAFAQNALGPGTGVHNVYKAILGILVFLTPQAFNIAQWYNTIIPGVWVIAVFSVCCICLPRKVCIGLMLIFVPLAYSSYNTYPFVILATLLISHDAPRGPRDYASVMFVFIASLALAMAGVNFINWAYHGSFAIEIADWRQPNRVESIDDLFENLALVQKFISMLLINYGSGVGRVWVGYAIFSASLVSFLILMKLDRWEALYAATPAVMGLGLLAAYCLINGVLLPVRATIFVWACTSYALVRTVILLGGPAFRSILLGGPVLFLCAYLAYQQSKTYQEFAVWQRVTRSMAEQISPLATRIFVYGDFWAMREARAVGIQTGNGLSSRLQYLTGAKTVLCKEEPDSCSGETPPFDEMPRFGSLLVENSDDTAFIRLPAWELAP